MQGLLMEDTHSSEASRTPSVKHKQSMDNTAERASLSPRYIAYSINDKKRMKVDHSDPFAVRDGLMRLDSPKYGSVTKDIEELLSKRKQMFMPRFISFPALKADPVELKTIVNGETKYDTNKPNSVVIIDSDDDEPTCSSPSQPDLDVVLNKPNEQSSMKQFSTHETNGTRKKVFKSKYKSFGQLFGDKNRADIDGQVSLQKLPGGDNALGRASIAGGDTTTSTEPKVGKDKNKADDDMEGENDKNTKDDDVEGENDKNVEEDDDVDGEDKHDKGEYVGVQDSDTNMDESDGQSDINFDGLADIWNEMSVGLESSRNIDPTSNERTSEDIEECDHTFILKEDIGYVCRVCGIIQRSIESIIEFQRPKKSKSIRTYYYEGQTKSGDAAGPIHDGVKLTETDFSVSELSAHPRHKKQMKPHQVEGFNFLLSNLVSENPGGCILAHAPGSGKTFMLISFIQTFMAKYPDARPLVILPRGILGTWKKEFIRWRIEDLPLLDFYTEKAEGRSQQLDVLKQWVNQRSILFLGYQQFASIVSDSDTSSISVSCQEILLTRPSILILDEGHTPRNQDTNIFTSLEKVQTRRKVVLSGTLYQNHVTEVFNILNLVRPKFLKMENSKVIKRRILSRAPIGSRKNLIKKSTDNEFYEVVENTLVKDDNFKRKVSIIDDLREMTSKVLHYYKGDFLDELPGLVDFSVFLKLSPKQKQEVSELRKLAWKFKISSDGSAIYVHPGLKSLLKNPGSKERNDDSNSNSNIDKLVKKVDEMEGVKAKFFLNMLRLCESGGEKLLVFGQYLLPLRFLVRLTMKTKGWSLGKEIFIITGDHDNDEREKAMDQFNNSPESRVFFGSIKACGEGISLVGASRIIILDVHLNPSITRQALGRAFRPGQVRKVYTYRLIAAESPEEEDHATCFKKESIAKMWFEWNEYCGHHDFEMEEISVKGCGDQFLETSFLNQDITAIYKR